MIGIFRIEITMSITALRCLIINKGGTVNYFCYTNAYLGSLNKIATGIEWLYNYFG